MKVSACCSKCPGQILICLYYKFTLAPLPYITVDMLLKIVGHNIDGNYESMSIILYGAKTVRDRHVPGRDSCFPHPGVRRFLDVVQIMHIYLSYFIFHIFFNKKPC